MTKLSLIALALVLLRPAGGGTADAGAAPGLRERTRSGFVSDAIPDEQRVRQCLVRNMRRLNPTCRSAFHRKRGR